MILEKNIISLTDVNFVCNVLTFIPIFSFSFILYRYDGLMVTKATTDLDMKENTMFQFGSRLFTRQVHEINFIKLFFIIFFVLIFFISDPFDGMIRSRIEEQQKDWHKIIHDSKQIVSNDGKSRFTKILYKHKILRRLFAAVDIFYILECMYKI